MDEIKKPETKQETMERFDSFVRATLLEEGSKHHAENGYLILTENDVAYINTLSELKDKFTAETK